VRLHFSVANVSFIFCETCLTFSWKKREGGITRGKDEEEGRERERGKERVGVRLTTRRERVRMSVRGRGKIEGRGDKEI
jgi:hypothetical protein